MGTVMPSGLVTSNDEDNLDFSIGASFDRYDGSSWQEDISDETQVKLLQKEHVGGNMPPDIRRLELELVIKQAALEVEKMKIEADNQRADRVRDVFFG